MKNLKPIHSHQNKIERSVTIFLVLVTFLIRVIRLDVPHDWSFDEVYHALSAEAYALNDPRGYEWWNENPKDLAFEWLHPPIGKLLMAASIKIFATPYIPQSKQAPVDGRTTFAWRFPGTVFAALTVLILIRMGKKMFGAFWVGAVAGGLYGLDGLSFVQSRTGMNDIFITCFVVFGFYRLFVFFSEYPSKKLKNLFWIGIATGLAAATKWTGFYLVGMVLVWGVLFLYERKDWKTILWAILYLGVFPPIIYILSYTQWWIQGHTWDQFYELHQQIWWYQTGLTATHDYQSPALTWPLLYRPVWFYVKYQDVVKNGTTELYIGNIYTMGNPLIWWAGVAAIVYITWLILRWIWDRIEGRTSKFTSLMPFHIILVGYFGMFLPWAFSPRIMFLYHYLPSIPFLCLALAYSLYRIRSKSSQGRKVVNLYLALVVIAFIYFYPHWSGVLLPQKWVEKYYWLKSWK